MEKKKIAIVFGTRPEAIKMAPVILELQKQKDHFEPCIIVSAQHREMLDQVLDVFDIKPDYDLDIMRKNQTLSDITSDVLKGIETVLVKEQPDMVLVHGDTTTSFAAALAAYYHKIPIGHVEAGLRTHNKYSPFPEEGNRKLIDTLADLYFAPTEQTRDNLLTEGIENQKIVVTGNTAIDTINYTKKITLNNTILDDMKKRKNIKWIILTMHRRENLGEPMENVFRAVKDVLKAYKDVEVIMPVHLGPAVKSLVYKRLGNDPKIHLIEPLNVDVFHHIMKEAYLILTDSGGLQEEAPELDVPVLVLRDKTERPEGILSGTLKVVGTNRKNIFDSVEELLLNEQLYNKMSHAVNPYGDGFASIYIIEKIKRYFKE